ncbi:MULTISPECIES: hypothetical protein [Enterobacter]|uniref:Uncharacterized protein n=1 Tax=Enterobacter vonholyi TaxID=2797505 RepID=A0ABU6E366_9ENTR|nr:hypothetical protein [Enterobacter vonholyi]MEB6410657.1 hypothetical protein [Enterobacter vonholyi]
MYFNRPNPHPLDYDWRFTKETVSKISNMVYDDNALVIGAPSVAEFLEKQKKDVLLIDRHPIQLVNNHLQIDINTSPIIKANFSYVIMDPPWYLDVFFRWISWAANSVGKGATIILSIWPDNTRPLAIDEKEQLFSWIRTWGEISIEKNCFTYITSDFEKKITKPSDIRQGDFLKINVITTPKMIKVIEPKNIWYRYIIDDYQLAIKSGPNLNDSNFVQFKKVEGAEEWLWPSVSKRAVGRDYIQIWSSNNEVAMLDNPETLISLLENENDISKIIKKTSSLAEWSIPKKPHGRIVKWQEKN